MSALQDEVSRLWVLARAIEQERDPQRIRRVYERIVEIDPLQPAAWLKLSQLSLHDGSYRDARNAALRAAEAISLSRRWRALPHVTMQLLHFDERALVSSLVASADWEDDAVLAQAAVLAQRLWLADDAATALALLDRAMPSQPANFRLHSARGEVLNHLGRFEEAETEYLRCLELEPAYPYAYLSLVQNRRSKVPGARVGRIRAARAAASTEKDGITLDYAMFHEQDAAGDIDAAWLALESGARMQRAIVAFDGAAEQRNLEALIESFADAPPLPGDRAPVGSRRCHVFIVGLPRSGTTLLDRMFGNHPLVGSAGELNSFSRSLSWEIDAYYEPPPSEGIARRARDCDWKAVGTGYVEATSARHPDKPYLLDKNPQNIYNAGYIAKAIPQARILCLSRNPMDACFSNMKELFAPASYGYSYDQRELAEHFARFRMLVACWRRQLPGQFHVVDYEALVDDPERELERAMHFCGLDFDPAYVDITRNKSPVSTASSAQVREPLNRRGLGAWRRYRQYLQPLAARLTELGIEVD
ncbi:sulfotransferase family protein [Thermomonas aquatica]|uniref:Sulfotransferase family protein n=1 Tax=Thermomonas aquatica TaxID=2202149 RepID=A0A5B7ZRR3_9GAMM|nr:sulfotransferase [Thermomonas aquatica]QDA57894.1 hypothetical protein FHQ07_11540 [Thermomonas aquatica]